MIEYGSAACRTPVSWSECYGMRDEVRERDLLETEGGLWMNSKERVLKAVNFEKPDRVPIDLGGIRASGVNAVAYSRLKRGMGINTPTRIHDSMQMLGDVELEVLEKLGGDILPVDSGDRAWAVASDDAGTQRAGLISPELFTEMIKPHYRRVCEWVHEHTGWKTFLHACGSVRGYIGDWIDAGVDILNPVQIAAAGMEPVELMKEFGGRIVFWGGGCDT